MDLSVNAIRCPLCKKVLDWKHLWVKGLRCDVCGLDYKKLKKSIGELDSFMTYFLKEGDRVVYVGCTMDLNKRLGNHDKLKFYLKRGHDISVHLSMILGEMDMYNIYHPEWNKNKPDHEYSEGVRLIKDGNYKYVSGCKSKDVILSKCKDNNMCVRGVGLLFGLDLKLEDGYDSRRWCYKDSTKGCNCKYACVIRIRHMIMLGRQEEFKRSFVVGVV